ncbi:MAG: homogentisate 1,2-dioxygenase [Lewinellaceae bacterium]|nr:homogentisate 1,2-dioxygenase [Lewinellaceae bacterium]
MPFYHRMGRIPAKRHIVFRQPDGSLYQEELVGTEGFSGMSSLVYHLHAPTQIRQIQAPVTIAPKIAVENNLYPMKFAGFDLLPEPDYIRSRKTLFVNSDLSIGLAAPSASPDYFFKNADADEILFVHRGKGDLQTMFGNVNFGPGDYLVIPRGTIYKLDFESSDNRLLFIESRGPVTTPRRYRNDYGQMLEHSPFCERDIRIPEVLETYEERGEFEVRIKKQNALFPVVYAHHPFDVIGWDGYHYPYAFNIRDFEPLTGRIHMPPPIHQTFEGRNFVVCSFVPRLYDYHPDAIPAPYHHSNIDSDELLYYVEGNFMSRNNVGPGQITLHPAGIPHGPHPGAIERSIGQTATEELAVMIDPFQPVMITEEAMALSDPNYYKVWLEK